MTVLLCNGCTACCEGDTVFLHPEDGDDPSEYSTEIMSGRLVLAWKDGSCVYLRPGYGCSIYDRRPSACRGLDCRIFLRNTDELIRHGIVREDQVEAARRLDARMKQSRKTLSRNQKKRRRKKQRQK